MKARMDTGMTFENLSLNFQDQLKAVGEANGKTVIEMFQLWREYCKFCRDADQYPVWFEFCNWNNLKECL